MPVEFIGIAHTSDYSETNALSGPVVQPDYLYRSPARTSSPASTGC